MDFLETPRLFCRLFRLEDAPDLFRFESNPDVVRYIRPPVSDPLQSKNRIVQEIAYAALHEGLGLFACFEKASNSYIGLVKMKHVENTDAIEVGYGFIPEAWGKGYATEVTQKAIEYLQQNFANRPIVAFISPENLPSRRVLEKLGMVEVQNAYQGHEDAVVFGILEHAKSS